MGVIDALSAGFTTAVRRAWLMAIPVALDLFLWLGARLSIEPVVANWVSTLESAGVPGNPGLLPEEVKTALLQWAAQSNLFALVRTPAALTPTSSAGWLVPVGEAGLEAPATWTGFQPAVVEVASLGMVLGLSVLLFLAGLFTSTLYLCLIAQIVRGEEGASWLPSWRTIGRTWRRLLIYVLALGLLLAMLGVPLSALVAMALLTGQSFMALILNFSLLAFLWVWVWLTIYLLFAVDAIVLNQVGVWAGVWTSMQVVGRNFWPTVGLFVLSNLIAAGTGVIWGQVAGSPWGVLAGILGNGFIQTGLIAASLIFFRARYAQLSGAPAADKG